jgi:transposase-like protein
LTYKLDNPIFKDADKAREHLEAQRWPDGPYCPHCGNADKTRILKMDGEAHRAGLYNCRECRKQFSVTVGTVFERSKVPLNTWLLATYLLCSSKKGMSAHQYARMLGVTYKTAWFMLHRIREAMRPGDDATGPKGGEGKIVEADETYIGGKEKNKHLVKRHSGRGGVGKQVAFALVERGGSVRAFHVANVSGATLRPVIVKQIDRASTLMTDEGGQYHHVGGEFARHGKVNHSIDEYVRGDCHTNTVEGYFSILKRGIFGTYHHVSEAHLKRYLCEFDFRYNERSALGVTDGERADKALKGIAGKRLTYRRTDGTANA